MRFSFEGKCVLELEHEPGMKKSRHVQTKFNLDVSKNLQRKQYLDNEDLPTADGSKVLTNVFVQGLIGNIHHAHEKGFWNDAEHIKYIIAELERGFVEIAQTGTSTF
jgi:hypothetical protein